MSTFDVHLMVTVRVPMKIEADSAGAAARIAAERFHPLDVCNADAEPLDGFTDIWAGVGSDVMPYDENGAQLPLRNKPNIISEVATG